MLFADQNTWSGIQSFQWYHRMMSVSDMRPAMATQQQPGLPVYILFMCIRHTDYMNNDDKVRSLLTNIINCIKKTVKVTCY